MLHLVTPLFFSFSSFVSLSFVRKILSYNTQFSRGLLASKTVKVPSQPFLTSDVDLLFRTFMCVFVFLLMLHCAF